MPIYEYQCPSCSHEFERIMRVSADAPDCPECGDQVKKKVSMSSFHLKGEGWYVTEYGKSGKKKEDKATTGADESPAGESPTESSANKESSEAAPAPTATKSEGSTSTESAS